MVLIIIALNSFHVAIDYTKGCDQHHDPFHHRPGSAAAGLDGGIGRSCISAFFHPVIILLNEYKRFAYPICCLAAAFLSALLIL